MLADYDLFVPEAYRLLEKSKERADHWEVLRPFCYSLESALNQLEACRSEQNLLAMDRDANLLSTVCEEVWRWKETKDP